jgi:hypothetical protein
MTTTVVEVLRAADLVEQLGDEPELLAIADAIAVTQQRRSRSAWSGKRMLVAASLAAALAAVIATLVTGRDGTESAQAATQVKTLAAFSHLLQPKREVALPTSARNFIDEMAATAGKPVAAIQEPISGEPSVYLVTLRPDDLCVVVALHGASGSCHVALRQAGGAAEAEVAIVDGRTFVLGLAADDVTGVAVTAAPRANAPQETFDAQVTHNVFLAELPFGERGTGPIELTITLQDGAARPLDLPGIPIPPSP